MSRTRLAKLVAPRAQDVVRRPRVLHAIERALSGGACWVVAPAGYGKTTALADYLRSTGARRLWYRVDEGDQDVASFFHYLAAAVQHHRARGGLPVFGPEYADQPEQFARRFFRAWFAQLRAGTLLVLDDLHRADAPHFRDLLVVLLQELPARLRCACLSRTPPGRELSALRKQGRLSVVDESVLRFSEREGRALLSRRMQRVAATVNIRAVRGWAAGLVLLAEGPDIGTLARANPGKGGVLHERRSFEVLAARFVDSLPRLQREALLTLSLLPEIRPDLARALVGDAGEALLETLQRRQLLVTRGESSQVVLHLHDLLRDFLQQRFVRERSSGELARAREDAASVLADAGHIEPAVDLALAAQAWALAGRLITGHAEVLLAQGRRATLIEWCNGLPRTQLDAWLCYWLGVAHTAEDAAAENWLAQAWNRFEQSADLRGLALTAARTVLAKTDSWRTHQGLSVWTERMIGLIGQDPPDLSRNEQLLVWTGMLRAVDFAADQRTPARDVSRLIASLLAYLHEPRAGDSTTLRLMASTTLIEHAGSASRPELFEQAVDSVRTDIRAPDVLPWALGLWLVAFGAVTARYFSYQRRGFPYASAEDALRAAIAIGEREALRGVEFGALYHLQLQMKARNDLAGFGQLIARLAEIADSRYTTQVAVVADCQAALHTLQGNFASAGRACERFMAAIEAADEPPIERWPHFITRFQVLLGERRAAEAAAFLESLIHLFEGGVRERTWTCVLVARTFEAKWRGDAHHPQLLRECMEQMRGANWPAVLLNLPHLLSELCADALERNLEPDFCRSLIRRRALPPPATRPASWPWALIVHVLGDFELLLEGVPVNFGAKPPARSLDLIRLLAVSRDQTCSLERIYEWLWPQADGDQAKAACDQALHRLRKLLQDPTLVVQREGKLRLAPDRVWVDLVQWEHDVAMALEHGAVEQLKGVFHALHRPVHLSERAAPWLLPAAERVQARYVDLALRLGHIYATHGDTNAAIATYQRALELYPTSERCCDALLRTRIARSDIAGAIEDYRRYERMLASTLHAKPSRAMRDLIQSVTP